MDAGATSAIYMGERFEAAPMATPPAMRQNTKALKLNAQPVRRDDAAKSMADRMSSFLRPYLSLSAPEKREPRRHPSNAQLFAHPSVAPLESWKYFSKNGLAPPMTTQS